MPISGTEYVFMFMFIMSVSVRSSLVMMLMLFKCAAPALAKKNYSVQQILLRQFQRGSTYSYFFGGGIRYAFGSIFNNVVNPRFE